MCVHHVRGSQSFSKKKTDIFISSFCSADIQAPEQEKQNDAFHSYPSVRPSIHPSIYPFIHPSFQPAIHLSILHSTNTWELQ